MTDHTDSPREAEAQQADQSWPKPGDEGYVTPDGTPQAAAQLAENRRAAADRAAAGSIVHGAPAATPGPQLDEQAAAAVKRAEDHNGPTVADRDKAVTEFVRDAQANPTQRDADRPEGDQAQR